LPSASTSQHEIVTDPNASRPEDSNKIQGGSNMTGTDLYVNKPHCAAAVRT